MRALEGSFVHIDNKLDFRSHHIGWHLFASRSGCSNIGLHLKDRGSWQS